MQEPILKPLNTSVNVDELLKIDERSRVMMSQVRDSMLAPHPGKEAPIYTTTTLSSLCGIDRNRLNYLLKKGDLPQGEMNESGRSRHFTLTEARQWIKAIRREEFPALLRPDAMPGFSIVAANFKGGSTKTTTVMTLAQGLTLKGNRVLVIDLDPQASLTALCGLLPEKDVGEGDTVMPLIYGDEPDLRYAVRQTYWDGLDIVPAAPALFAAEFHIPSQVATQKANPDWMFWNIIANGIQPLRQDYDVIIFDTAPALSYLTINALIAGDGMVMPLPPRSLDYASSTQFWSLFSDLVSSFQERGFHKKFEFVSVLLSAVNSQEAATPIVRDWIQDTYERFVLPVEIPLTSVAGVTSAQFGSVYDVSKWEGSAKTYQRARQAYDGFVDLIEQKIVAHWIANQEDK